MYEYVYIYENTCFCDVGEGAREGEKREERES